MTRVHAAVPVDLLDATDRVVVFGDSHGVAPAMASIMDRAARAGVRVLLSVGDYGIGPWPGESTSFTDLVDRYLVEDDAWLLVTPGNHENYDRIDAAPLDAADMVVLGERTRVLPRGYRWRIGGRSFASLGGAYSVDRRFRRLGASWWAQEEITEQDLAALGSEPVEVLITHEVPSGAPVTSTMRLDPVTELEADRGRRLVRRAVEDTAPQVVLSGHWHQRLTHLLERTDGGISRIEVLADGSWPISQAAVVLDLRSEALATVPL